MSCTTEAGVEPNTARAIFTCVPRAATLLGCQTVFLACMDILASALSRRSQEKLTIDEASGKLVGERPAKMSHAGAMTRCEPANPRDELRRQVILDGLARDGHTRETHPAGRPKKLAGSPAYG